MTRRKRARKKMISKNNEKGKFDYRSLWKMSIKVSLLLLVGLVFSFSKMLLAQSPFVIDRSLVAYLTFDEGEGDIAFDATAEHNDGTLLCEREGCTPPRWVLRGEGYTLEFDGAEDFVFIPFSPLLQPADEITFSAVINPKALPAGGGQMQIITHEVYGYRFAVLSSELSLIVKLPDSDRANRWGEVVYAAGGIIPERWQYVVATYSSADRRIHLYIDGEIVGVSEPFLGGEGKITYLANTSVTIGRGGTTGWWRAFHGLIDEVRIYNRALSPEEVQALYRQVTAK